MRKRLLSLLLCLCMVLGISTVVYGASGFSYVNTYYAASQNVILNVSNGNLSVNVYLYEGETISPYLVLDGVTEIPLEKSDYGYSISIPLTNASYIVDVVDMTDKLYMCEQISLSRAPGNHYFFFMGTYSNQNSTFRTNNSGVSETNLLPVNPEVKIKSDEICAGKKIDSDKAYAIYEWICTNIGYDRDALNNLSAYESTYTSPSDVLKNKRAVCEGLSNLFMAMCNAQNIPCRVIIGQTPEISNISGHAWNEVYLAGDGNSAGWYFVDCTAGGSLAYENGTFSPKYSEKQAKYNRDVYFMSDEKMVDSYVMYSGIADTTLVSLDSSASESVSDWAVDDIKKAVSYSLLQGDLLRDNYTTPVTRRYFCELLSRYVYVAYLENATTNTTTINEYAQLRADANNFLFEYMSLVNDEDYSDILPTDWRIGFCMGAGIAYGKSATEFCPDDYLTRAEAATMLYRLYNFMKANGFGDKFTLKSFSEIGMSDYFVDHNDIPDWALDGCYGCKDKGVIKGDDNNRFLPNNELTAEQCVAILSRMLQTK